MVVASGHAMHLGVEIKEACDPLELSLKALLRCGYCYQSLEAYFARFDVVKGWNCSIVA